MNSSNYKYSVFINCPFDVKYKKMLNATIFTIHDCGFIARCAMELIDGLQIRIEKISDIISSCKLGIHDISRTELDPVHKLPRFNMPLELGIFWGAKKFGSSYQKRKSCLILDKEPHRYQKYCSDIAGQDISSHDGNIRKLIRVVRDWLQANHPDNDILIPSGSIIYQRYSIFKRDLPLLCQTLHLDMDELTFNDLTVLIIEWLRKNMLIETTPN